MCCDNLATAAVAAAEPKAIELTQIPCQFVESENGVDHGYTSVGPIAKGPQAGPENSSSSPAKKCLNLY